MNVEKKNCKNFHNDNVTYLADFIMKTLSMISFQIF